ncbi:hypothetical protein VTO73DRAFT_3632 [Trametes versicolor]
MARAGDGPSPCHCHPWRWRVGEHRQREPAQQDGLRSDPAHLLFVHRSPNLRGSASGGGKLPTSHMHTPPPRRTTAPPAAPVWTLVPKVPEMDRLLLLGLLAGVALRSCGRSFRLAIERARGPAAWLGFACCEDRATPAPVNRRLGLRGPREGLVQGEPRASFSAS